MMAYLINPSEKNILESAGDRIPYGLLAIATEKGNTKVYDLNHDSEEQLMKDFENDKPTSVGISVYTSPLYPEAVRLAERFKGKTYLIAGGYHATAMPESLDVFDEVFQGRAIKDFKKTKNVDFSLVNLDRYGVNYEDKRYGTLITSVGCPFDCSFCFNMSRKVQFKEVDYVKQEINDLAEHFDGIYFLDDIFTINKERMATILSHATIKGLESRVTTRADLVDSDKMKIMSELGVKWLSIGIESGNDEILKKSNKRMTIWQNYDVVKLASDYDIKTKGFFIIGLPGETEETARQTIDFSLKLRDIGLKQADFYFLTPFPGTPIWNNPKHFDIEIIDRDFTKYLQAGRNAHCYINTKELKAKRIEELVMEAKERWTNQNLI